MTGSSTRGKVADKLLCRNQTLSRSRCQKTVAGSETPRLTTGFGAHCASDRRRQAAAGTRGAMTPTTAVLREVVKIMRDNTDRPSAPELWDAIMEVVPGALILAPLAPGFLLCVPGLVLFVLVAAAPVVVVMVVGLAGAVCVTPYFLVRFIYRRWHTRSVKTRLAAAEPVAAPSPSPLNVPAEYVLDI